MRFSWKIKSKTRINKLENHVFRNSLMVASVETTSEQDQSLDHLAKKQKIAV